MNPLLVLAVTAPAAALGLAALGLAVLGRAPAGGGLPDTRTAAAASGLIPGSTTCPPPSPSPSATRSAGASSR
ncbi:hypothetical protein [Kitasatospora sp. NPDC058046]|uniref:hypothetical protein n=1 Tax=Kitasatospora sp. NPDC058046 TaxID=3346312 RepID=UPI0036D80433